MASPGKHPRAAAGGGVTIGRPFGIPVVVSPTWLLVAALIAWIYAPAVQGQVPGLGTVAAHAVALGFAVLLYLSVLIHELSHSLTAIRLGLPVRRITLHLLGGVSEIARQPETPSRSFLISAAGPVVNFVLAALAYGVVVLTAEGTVVHVLAVALTGANILVGVFNLLPGLPLDGGHVLEAVVWRLTGRRTAGTVAAAYVGYVLAAVLVAAPLLLAGTGAVSLVTVVWGALLGSFIVVGARQAVQAARARARLPELSVRRLLRRALTVPPDLPVAEAVRRAEAAGVWAVVVADRDGTPLGIVEEAAVRAMPRERRPWVAVADVSRRSEPGTVLDVELASEDLVAAIQRRPASEYLVVDGAGRLSGVLSLADVERALSPG